MASAGANRLVQGRLRLVAPALASRPAASTSLQFVSRRASRARSPCVQGRDSYSPIRPFSSSAVLFKKRKVADAHPPSSSTSTASPSDSSKTPQPDPENPLDFSALTAAYSPVDSHYRAQLQALLHGGRFNPSHLGSLPVTVKTSTGDGSNPETFPLRELAQVVPRPGRTISLLVNEREYIKPIMSAVQASKDFNQQPQRSEDNDLELVLRVELERRDEVVRRAKETCQGWRERVRQARTKHEKVLQEWKRNKTVLPDVVRKAEKEMQKVQDKKMKDIDQEEAQTIRQLERNAS